MMSHDDSFRELTMQSLHQLTQGFHLLWRPGVRRPTVSVESTLIAYPDAVSVVSCTVCPDLVDAASRLNGSVTTDDEMIAS